MAAAPFRRVLVPVEFETAGDAEVAPDRVVKVGDRDWVSFGPWTIAALELAARLTEGGESIDRLNETARVQSQSVLERIATRHCPGVDVRVQVATGKPLAVILDLAKQHPPDAIVLAASSRGRVRRALLGSTADKIIRQAFCPVVVVPSGNG
jgi:nucleotide-binding universal stress UspA family protein